MIIPPITPQVALIILAIAPQVTIPVQAILQVRLLMIKIMTKKEQNKALVNLKKERHATLNALDDILYDAVETLGYEPDDDIAVDWINAYLNGDIPLKDLHKKIADDKAQFEENLKFG